MIIMAIIKSTIQLAIQYNLCAKNKGTRFLYSKI